MNERSVAVSTVTWSRIVVAFLSRDVISVSWRVATDD